MILWLPSKAVRWSLASLGVGNALPRRALELRSSSTRMLMPSASRKLVGRSGFEPLKAMPADLQSAPFGHFGTYPLFHPSQMKQVVKNAISFPNRPSESISGEFH